MDQDAPRRRPRLSMRWKLLVAFGAAFTLVFAFIAFWVVQYAGDTARDRLTAQLLDATVGTAGELPKKAVAEVAGVDPDVGPAAGRVTDDLNTVRATIPEADPYLYFVVDDRLYVLAKGLREPAAGTLPDSTLDAMRAGLRETTLEPENDQSSGSWVSAYSPVVDDRGTTIAAVGIDYSLQHVRDVQSQARAQVLPVLGAGYVILLLLVLLVSTLLVRPIRRLTLATGRIADGEYDLDLDQFPRSTFRDELTDLADSVKVMADKVASREQALTTQVQRLQVQVDRAQREQSVREITETDFFADLAAKADDLRARMHRDESSGSTD